MWYSAEPAERWEAGGEWLLIRPISPADAVEHDAFFHRLSPEDIRLRFFAAVRELTSAQLDKFTRLDYDRDMALIAVRRLLIGPAEVRAALAALARRRALQPAAAAVGAAGVPLVAIRARRTTRRERLAERNARSDHDDPLSAGPDELARHLGFQLRHLLEDQQVIEARLRLARPSPI